jgi:hypothetical protein
MPVETGSVTLRPAAVDVSNYRVVIALNVPTATAASWLYQHHDCGVRHGMGDLQRHFLRLAEPQDHSWLPAVEALLQYPVYCERRSSVKDSQ